MATTVKALYRGALATGSLGALWTSRSVPTSANWSAITYGGGVFVAVATGSSTAALSSPDGITWTARTLPTSGSWTSVAYGGGVFVANSSNSSAPVTVQLDGIDLMGQQLVAANGVVSLVPRQVLAAGKTIKAVSTGTASLSLHLTGIEIA